VSLRLAKTSSLQAGCSFDLGEDGDEHILLLTLSQNPKESQQTKPTERGKPHTRVTGSAAPYLQAPNALADVRGVSPAQRCFQKRRDGEEKPTGVNFIVEKAVSSQIKMRFFVRNPCLDTALGLSVVSPVLM